MRTRKWLVLLLTMIIVLGAGTGVALALTGDEAAGAEDGSADSGAPGLDACYEDPGGGNADVVDASEPVLFGSGAVPISVPIGRYPGDVQPGLDPDPVGPVPGPFETPIVLTPGGIFIEPYPDDAMSFPVTQLPKGPSPATDPDVTTIEARAPIESLEIEIMESFPPQYNLVIVSGLPNGCVSFGGAVVGRDGDTIRVEVTNRQLTGPDLACTAICGMVRTGIALGSDFEPGRTYTIVVNDVTKTFVAQ